jgi:hypothetical protein
MLPNQSTSRQLRRRDVYRSGCMVLHPLAEVRIRVLMTIVVSGGKFMVHILRNGKRREAEKQTNYTPYHSGTQ